MTDQTQALYNEANGPTPERRARLGANLAVGGKGRDGIPQVRYRSIYEITADPSLDALREDYGECFSRIVSARYAFDLSAKANAGKASDTCGDGSADSMPLADFYIAVKRRFVEHRNHMAQHGVAVDHWSTIDMLMSPLRDGLTEEQIKANRSALLQLVPEVETALDMLAEASLAVSKGYRQRVDLTSDSQTSR